MKKSIKKEPKTKAKELEVVELKNVSTMYGDFQTVIIPRKFQQRKAWARKSPFEILSFIPGTIMEMFVKEGDTVSKGDLIYSFKAMKMENKVESEIDGTINKIYFNAGDSFPKGALVVEYIKQQ